jgi:hypothetical protein
MNNEPVDRIRHTKKRPKILALGESLKITRGQYIEPT